MHSFLLSLPVALAGYGDLENGYPSYEERVLHLYTNLVRVDPEAFEGEFAQGGCSIDEDFEEEEQTPKPPLPYSLTLNEAARYHSDDMASTGVLTHNSSDGTSFGERLSQLYPESSFVGENIAVGYTMWSAVFQGWMCSAGHRSNIMNPDWSELGTGISSSFFTQNFGGGLRDSAGPLFMGVHDEVTPGMSRFLVDYAGPSPERVVLILDEVHHEMDLGWGSEEQGVYTLELEAAEGECLPYYFVSTDGEETSVFPAEGQYFLGAGCPDWERREQTLGPWEEEEVDGLHWSEELEVIGCRSLQGRSQGLVWGGWALLLVMSRRRRSVS